MSSATSTESPGLRPWHFFVVIALAGATAAVLAARDSGATALVLVALAVIAAGGAGLTFHQALWALVTADGEGNGGEGRGRARAALEREKQLVLWSIRSWSSIAPWAWWPSPTSLRWRDASKKRLVGQHAQAGGPVGGVGAGNLDGIEVGPGHSPGRDWLS